MRRKVAMGITECLIRAYHFGRYLFIRPIQCFERVLDCFQPCLKWLKTVSTLFFRILFNFMLIRVAAFLKGLNKCFHRNIQKWGKLLARLLPALGGTLTCYQKHPIHIKEDSTRKGLSCCFIDIIITSRRDSYLIGERLEKLPKKVGTFSFLPQLYLLLACEKLHRQQPQQMTCGEVKP